MFIGATKGDSDLTYVFSVADIEVKVKFKSSFSKVKDWKENFIVMTKFFATSAIEAKSLTPWGFTIYWVEILGNWGKNYYLKEVVKKENP